MKIWSFFSQISRYISKTVEDTTIYNGGRIGTRARSVEWYQLHILGLELHILCRTAC